ncbi:MAG: hypothetical protein ACRDWI_09425 [Jiangellaceae bacterium]
MDDPELLSYEIETLPIVLTARSVNGRTPVELASHPLARDLFVSTLVRGGVAVPLGAHTPLHRGRRGHRLRPDAAGRAGRQRAGPAQPGQRRDRLLLPRAGNLLGRAVGVPTIAVAGGRTWA